MSAEGEVRGIDLRQESLEYQFCVYIAVSLVRCNKKFWEFRLRSYSWL